MNIPYELLLWMAALGACGGFVNCLVSGQLEWPCFDKNANCWRPGWIGNVIVGAVAALVVWGVYGPASNYLLSNPNNAAIPVTLNQFLSSLVVGLSGGRILTLHAEKLVLQSEKEAEKAAKTDLAEVLKRSLK